MNTTTNATATTTVTTITNLKHGDELAVHAVGYRGAINDYASHFLVNTLRGACAKLDLNFEERLAAGENEFSIVPLGFTISLHAMEQVERIEVAIGDLVTIDGRIFKIAPNHNSNLKLVPVSVTATEI